MTGELLIRDTKNRVVKYASILQTCAADFVFSLQTTERKNSQVEKFNCTAYITLADA